MSLKLNRRYKILESVLNDNGILSTLSTLSDYWIDHGFGLCFFTTLSTSLVGLVILVLGLVQLQFYRPSEGEIMENADPHPNVVTRYYETECKDYKYIAIQIIFLISIKKIKHLTARSHLSSLKEL